MRRIAFAGASAAISLAVACSDDGSSEIARMIQDDFFAMQAQGEGCLDWHYDGKGYFPETPVPYPTPAGERVEPKQNDIPVYPGSELLDSFVRDYEIGGARTVQHYRTADTAENVFAFFSRTLLEQRWAGASGGHGPAGKTCRWVPYALRNTSFESTYVEVTTWYVGREEGDGRTLSPGYQGQGIPFASPEPGYTWFWVLTPR